jgi:hypothetical protein
MYRWQAISIDIDDETGEAYVVLNRSGEDSYIVRLDPSSSMMMDQCTLPHGFMVNSIHVEQGMNGFLPFIFETVASRSDPVTMGFSFTGVTDADNSFDGLVDISSPVVEIPWHMPSVDVMVWGRGDAGLKKTKQGSGKTFDAADFGDPVSPIRLPVFTWSSESVVRIPSILVSMSDGKYAIVDVNYGTGEAVTRELIEEWVVPLGGMPATSIAVKEDGQIIAMANSLGVVEADSCTLSPISSVEQGSGWVSGGGSLRVGGFLSDGRVIGCSTEDGRLFTTQEITIYSSSSSHEWPSSSSSSSSQSGLSSSSSSSKSSLSSSSSSTSSSSSSSSSVSIGIEDGVGVMIIGERLPEQSGPLFVIG